MSLDKLNAALVEEVAELEGQGRAKAPERVIVGFVPPSGDRGPRYELKGSDTGFIRMNSNSYLSLSHHPDVLEAADEASRIFGAGPGAVRFIDGTFAPHAELEERIARFLGRPAARVLMMRSLGQRPMRKAGVPNLWCDYYGYGPGGDAVQERLLSVLGDRDAVDGYRAGGVKEARRVSCLERKAAPGSEDRGARQDR